MAKRVAREYLQEFEPPEKKLISAADLLIKELAEKQRNTTINLTEQLNRSDRFVRTTEILPISSLNSGTCSLSQLERIGLHISDRELVKSSGLCDEDVQLYFDYQNGIDFVIEKHRNYEQTLLTRRINKIVEQVEDFKQKKKAEIANDESELKIKGPLVKPQSVQSNPPKFANKSEIPHPMDAIKSIERDFRSRVFPCDVTEISNKVRRKARKLANRIGAEIKQQTSSKTSNASKWDVKTSDPDEYKPKIVEVKNYTCKPKKFYTVKDGEIVELNKEGGTIEISKEKVAVEEIVLLPKFENYSMGNPNKVLYIKNLPKKISEKDIRNLFRNYNQIVDVKIMSGRMKGQVFVTFKDESLALEALKNVNGTLINNKPAIIQFGKKEEQ